MDAGLTRREILKGMVATTGLPYLGEGVEIVANSGQETSTPATGARPGDDVLVAPSGWLTPVPAPTTPGPDSAPPVKLATPSANAPVIYEHTPEAGPDATFFLAGARLTPELFVWGSSAAGGAGQQWEAKIQFAHEHSLAATVTEFAAEGPFLIWAGNANGWSKPIRLNAPQPWWCGPDVASPGEAVRIFGRNLARRPEFTAAFVYLALPGKPGIWLNTEHTGKYSVRVRLPAQLELGTYQIWVHAGLGGAFGWGGPVKLKIQAAHRAGSSLPTPNPAPNAGHRVDLQGLLNRQVQMGGGTVLLGEGVFPFHGTLRVPKGVTLMGAGRDKTRLQLVDGSIEQIVAGEDSAAVQLAEDGASLAHLTLSGTPEVNLGVAVKSSEPLAWVSDCRIEDVRIGDIGRKKVDRGKFLDNYGVRLNRAAYAVVRNSEIWGRAPLFLSGVRQCRFLDNILYPLTVFDGNAEASILGRNEVIEECIIEGNRVASPPGTEAGGPTSRRLIWLSTGRASVTHNWLHGNGVMEAAGPGASLGAGQARFGGVAGTDQNVGETILFEANHRTMFFGQLAGADAQSVLLPRTIPPTPDDHLGTMLNGRNEARRDLLAHDAAGNETPFWPPDTDTGSEEPPIHEYYVSVFAGAGHGQTRRVLRREDNRLFLDRPWNEPPAAGSLVAIGTGFYQNFIVGNYVPDGMSGIQLWISCIENVIAGNTIARQRSQGIYLYANGSTLASSMPRSWNRGISPVFWNIVEGNRTDECESGVTVESGDNPRLPVEFPRALGNVIRHNSFVRCRRDGVALSKRGAERAASPSVAGMVVEFNAVRDASVGYRASNRNADAVIRRNHAFFWYPVNNSGERPVAYQVDAPDTTVVLELNNEENKLGK